MCRPGGRRCPSSSVARPSRSKEARTIRAAAPRVASSLTVALDSQQTTDPAYIARSGTSQVFVKAVPFEYLPSEVREPALRAAKAATFLVGQHAGELNKFEGKRMRASAVKHIENATSPGHFSPIAGQRALDAALAVKNEQDRATARIDVLAAGVAHSDIFDNLSEDDLPVLAQRLALEKSKVADKQQKVWDKVVALVDKDMPDAGPRERQRRFDEIGLSDPSELDGKYKTLMTERKALDAKHSNLSMTSLSLEVERQLRDAQRAIDADGYMGYRYLESTLSREDATTEDLKLARNVADEVVKLNKENGKRIRHTLRTWLPHNVSVKSAIAAGPEAYRPETKDDDPTVFSLLNAELNARDLELRAGVAARKLDARIAGV